MKKFTGIILMVIIIAVVFIGCKSDPVCSVPVYWGELSEPPAEASEGDTYKDTDDLWIYILTADGWVQYIRDGADGEDGEDGEDGADAGNYMDIGAFSSEFTGMETSRGFYFQAPVDFTIQDLEVFEDINGGVQNIAVIRFNSSAPPVYPSITDDFEVLFYEANMPADEKVSVSIEISAGDHIGILGTRGTSTMYNAYGPVDYASEIKGVPVVLYRMGMQHNMNTTAPQDIWQEPGGHMAMTHLRYF